MGPLDAPHDELRALAEGRAFADLSAYRKVRITGGDARGWLNDLVTCDVASLEPGGSRRSLLLTPTGHIRADFNLALDDQGFLLLQHPDQPEHIGLLLAPYVLSSDVSLHDSTHELALFCVPGAAADLVAHPGLSPSILGPGVDLVLPTGKPAWQIDQVFVKQGLVEVADAALEVRRVRRGEPRMGPDFDQHALPAEVGLEFAIDTTKGCFLGQESVARVRNLGHPPRSFCHLRADAPVSPGTAVFAGPDEVGTITSSVVDGQGGTVAIALLAWRARGGRLVTSDGIHLPAVGSTD